MLQKIADLDIFLAQLPPGRQVQIARCVVCGHLYSSDDPLDDFVDILEIGMYVCPGCISQIFQARIVVNQPKRRRKQ